MSYERAQQEYDNQHDSDDLMESTCGYCQEEFVHSCDDNNIYCKEDHESLKVYCPDCLVDHGGYCLDCWKDEIVQIGNKYRWKDKIVTLISLDNDCTNGEIYCVDNYFYNDNLKNLSLCGRVSIDELKILLELKHAE